VPLPRDSRTILLPSTVDLLLAILLMAE
jgi:hypothetical protein